MQGGIVVRFCQPHSFAGVPNDLLVGGIALKFGKKDILAVVLRALAVTTSKQLFQTIKHFTNGLGGVDCKMSEGGCESPHQVSWFKMLGQHTNLLIIAVAKQA